MAKMILEDRLRANQRRVDKLAELIQVASNELLHLQRDTQSLLRIVTGDETEESSSSESDTPPETQSVEASRGSKSGIHIKPSHEGGLARWASHQKNKKLHPSKSGDVPEAAKQVAAHSKNKHVAAMGRFAVAAKEWKH